MHAFKPTATLLSLLSSLLLTSAAPVTTAPSPVPYDGPGTYTITNSLTSSRVDLYLGNPANNSAMYAWCSSGPSYNPHQYFSFASFGSSSLSSLEIVNYDTGSLMAAASAKTTAGDGSSYVLVQGEQIPPSNSAGRWSVMPANSVGGPDNAVVLANNVYPGWALSLGSDAGLGNTCQSAKQLVLKPLVQGDQSQMWVLSHMKAFDM